MPGGSCGALPFLTGMGFSRSGVNSRENVALILIDPLRPSFVVVDHLSVIDTHETQDGGVQVVDVEFVLHRTQTQLIGLADG